MMAHTAESISLVAVPLDAPENLGREPKKKNVWRWACPTCRTDHPGLNEVVAQASENATAAQIIADPLCWYCRRARAMQQEALQL